MIQLLFSDFVLTVLCFDIMMLENSPLVPIDGWSSFDDEFLGEKSSIIRSKAGYFFMLFSLEEHRTKITSLLLVAFEKL